VSAVRVEALVTARLPIPSAYAFRPRDGNRLTRLAAVLRPGGEILRGQCSAYVVRHPTAGTILVDTGMHPDARRSLRADFGARMGLVFRGLRVEAPYDEQLRRHGVEPQEVERVVMTHLHVDHTSGMRLLPNARFVCAEREWAAATGRGAGGRGYAAHHLPPVERMELVDGGERHGPFGSTIDLLGDGSIRLVATPGHTPGHVSVLLRAEGRGTVLLVGDAVYTLRNLREEILPLLTYDDEASRRSMRELNAFAGAEPQAMLVPTHDPTAWRELAA
jgi:glyoxylase-like metal-dependent hydrolase (beta-lactamase superfamily II)